MKKDISNRIKREIILFLKTDEPKEFQSIDDYIFTKLHLCSLDCSLQNMRNIILSLIHDKLIVDVRRNKYDRHRYISTYAGIKWLKK